MVCSGCGKDIPFSGAVCPYCHRDKSQDQAAQTLVLGVAAVVGAIGWFVFGFLGGMACFMVAGVVAALFTVGMKPKTNTRPPEVRVVSTPEVAQPDGSLAQKLIQLKQLHDQGLLTEQEFATKKAEILARL